MARISASTIGSRYLVDLTCSFVSQYYNTLITEPGTIGEFYTEDAVVSHQNLASAIQGITLSGNKVRLS